MKLRLSLSVLFRQRPLWQRAFVIATDWTFYLFIKAVGWLNPLAHVIGLAICVWAYSVSRKIGYVLVGTCFLLTLVVPLITPTIRRAVLERWPPRQQLSAEAEQQYSQELTALNQKYFPKPRIKEKTLRIHFDQWLLVLGLWLLARRETKVVAIKSLQDD